MPDTWTGHPASDGSRDDKVSELERTRDLLAFSERERTRLGNELRRAQTILDATQRVSVIGGWELNLASGAVFWTDRVYRICGVTPEDYYPVLPDGLEFFVPECRPTLDEAINRCIHDGAPFNLELRLRTRQDELRWVRVRGEAQLEGGAIARLFGTIQDITERKELDAEMEENRRRLNWALEGGNEGIWTWNVATQETYFSPRWFGLLGFEKDALPHCYDTWRELIHPDDRSGAEWAVCDYVEGGDPDDRGFVIEFRMRTPEGLYKWIEGRGKIVARDEDGSPRIVAGTHLDITERRRAQEALERAKEEWERTFDAVPDLIAIIDKSYRIVRLNKAMAARIGRDPAECVGMQCHSIVHCSGEAPVICPHASMMLDEAEHSAELFEDRLGGYFLVTASPVRDRDGELIGSVHVARDITERRKAEEALIEARQAAEAANEAKSRFLANMSHELRTPLNAIIGFAELMLQNNAGTEGDMECAKRGRYLEHIHESGKHLLALINDLLDVTRIDAGGMRVKWEVFSIAETIAGVGQMLSRRVEEKNIQLDVVAPAEPLFVRADKRMASQIVMNLVGNAVKFSPEGSRIEVRLEADDNDEMARVWVIDNGPGIAPADRQNVFSEFFQADADRDAVLGGAGLGLALTRRLVSLLGGEIGVENGEEGGARFWFSLRRETRQPEMVDPPGRVAQTAEEPALPVLAGRTILVAEDNAINMELILSILQETGARLIAAADGSEAVEMARRERPDLVLMDIRMPGTDGLEATRVIRADSEIARMPVVALSASADEDSRRMALEAGCDDHLTKPVDIAALASALERFIPAPQG